MIAAPQARVAEALETYRAERDGSRLLRLLFWLRGLGTPRGTLRAAAAARGFTVLAEEPGVEIVLGIAGRFWAFDEPANMRRVEDARAFVDFDRPGWAKAAMSLRLEAGPNGSTRLSTETRVRCVDARAYRRFALYWALIGPFSGWLRRDLLRAIRRVALEPRRQA